MITKITGSVKSLQVYLDDTLFCPGVNFGWGDLGPSCSRLAHHILLHKKSKELADSHYQAFSKDFLSILNKEKDFSIKLDIEKWLEKKKI